MSDPNVKKTIQITPELFSINNSSGKTKKEKKNKTQKQRPEQRSNPLKKQLMNKIKSHAKKNRKTLKEKKDFASTFEEHMEYLSNLSRKKKLQIHSDLPEDLKKTNSITDLKEGGKTVTVKQDSLTDLNVNDSLSVPQAPVTKAPIPQAPVSQAPVPPAPVPPAPVPQAPVPPAPVPQAPVIQMSVPQEEIHKLPVSQPDASSRAQISHTMNVEPPYGILKKGNKPTYRQWHHSQTRKNRPSINKPHKEIKQHIKRKFSLGKKNHRVSVFLKNKKTRRKVHDELRALKKKPIEEIKEYLRVHNLIKAGSTAPHDVLRKLYQDTHLAGDITNKSTENMLHNYLAEDEQ